MHIAPPPPADYGFYSGYVNKAPNTDLLTALHENLAELNKLVSSFSDEDLLYRYETGKWNLKEVLVHLIDAERNYCYRIMRISRNDQAQLPMFDIHAFVMNSHATERDLNSIMDEMQIIRAATIAQFAGMHPSMLDRTGPAREVIISVRALGFAIVGHVMHHMDIIKHKYLTGRVK